MAILEIAPYSPLFELGQNFCTVQNSDCFKQRFEKSAGEGHPDHRTDS